MNIILIMIPLALGLLVVAGVVFFWAVNHGQFDDLDSPGILPVSDNLPEEDGNNSEEPTGTRSETQSEADRQVDQTE
jgi:cbb3-type cytochrome oxidase maturation protein